MSYYKITAMKYKPIRYPKEGVTVLKPYKSVFFIEGTEPAKACLRTLKDNGYSIESIKGITKEQYMKQEVNA